MFISIEGIEGAGKSTFIHSLKEIFIAKGHEIILTREPGGSKLGQKLRSIILNTQENICSHAELFLFLADRAQHLNDIILPALKANKTVICDRYADSTIAYQGYGRGMDIASLENLHNIATQNLWPHHTFLLDLDPKLGLARANSRNLAQKTSLTEGRFEAENLAFHTRIQQGFLERAKQFPARFITLDATQSPDLVTQEAHHAMISRGII